VRRQRHQRRGTRRASAPTAGSSSRPTRLTAGRSGARSTPRERREEPRRRPDNQHDARQGALDEHRLARQGRVRSVARRAPAPEDAAAPQVERAVPHPRLEGAQPQAGARRDRPDGQRAGPPGQRPRDGLRYLPPRARRGSAPRSLYRGRLDLLRVRRRPDGRRPAQPRRDRRRVPSRRPRSPGRTATSSASSSSK